MLNQILEGIYTSQNTERKLLKFLDISIYEHLNIFKAHSPIGMCFETSLWMGLNIVNVAVTSN